MARRDALLRLHKSLLARRGDLLKKLAGEWANLRGFGGGNTTGDMADAAFESGSDEMASQLAALDARELAQIERALTKLKQGTYGVCEGCGSKIGVTRLNALPYTAYCIDCQREAERNPDWHDSRSQGNWEKVFDVQAPLEEQREIRISDIEMDLSGNR
jgi:DnaK suppressor protein